MARIKAVLNERRLALIDAQRGVREGASSDASIADDDDATLFEDKPAAASPPRPQEESR